MTTKKAKTSPKTKAKVSKAEAARQRKLRAARRTNDVIPPFDPNKGIKAHDLDALEAIVDEELQAFPAKQRPALIHYLTQYLQGLIKLDLNEYETVPVDPKTFLFDPFFLGLKDEVYPSLIDEFIEMNSGRYIEIVLTGGIGTAKTTLALWSTAYQLYLLSCLKRPQKVFKLDKSSEIAFVFQSITEDLARKVNYTRFKAIIDSSPYFQTRFPYDRKVEKELKFPNRIFVRAISGEDTAAIGQNVIGGIIDEINFMGVTENSKRTDDGSTYDQAHEVYSSIATRRKSRFIKDGQVAGLLCLVSSRKYPNQFTDKKEEEAKTDKTIYVYDRTIWQVKPEGTYCGDMFKVFVGDATRKPRVLDDDEDPRKTYKPQDQHLVHEIPVEFRDDFKNNMVKSIRDIAGVSTLASHPYILNTDAIAPCFDVGLTSVFDKEITDFVTEKLKLRKSGIIDPNRDRFVHIDLSLTGDKTGFVMGSVPRFTEVRRGDSREILPVFRIDGAIAIRAPKGGEIQYSKIRNLIYALSKLGYRIKWITFDSHQSNDSRQILAQKGYTTGIQSVDASTIAYDTVKQAIYDGRLEAPANSHLQLELARLEYDTKKGKVDHPANFSKDVADSLAGVCHGLLMRRETWSAHGLNPAKDNEGLVKRIAQAEAKLEKQSKRVNTGVEVEGYVIEG